MNAVHKSILGKVFNDTVGLDAPGDSEFTDVPTNVDDSQDATISSPLVQAISDELEAAIDRLANISASSFNVAELAFIVGDCYSPQVAPTLLTIEPFIGTLDPGTSATRCFVSTIRALQALSHDLQELLGDSKTIDGDLTLRCENALLCVDLELERLLSAAWEAQQLQASRSRSCDTLGARRFDFPIPQHPTYQLSPIATAAIVIIATIHCFMNLARENCNFILRAMRGLLQLAFQVQQSRQRNYLTDNIEKIPTTLETAIHYLGLQADLVFYATCPKCSSLYPESEEVPQLCGAMDIDKNPCGNPLLLGRYRGKSTWSRPRRRYSHQLFEVWLARFLNRPGVEELIENTRPVPRDTLMDFWDAPYLNMFPGPGEKSFFDSPTESLRLAFLIYHDFFNPFTNKMAGKQKSVGVVLMVCLNLPYQIRYNRENVYTAAVIPGPSVPSHDEINHFMRPIAQNLKEHYNPGVWIARTHKYPNGRHVRSAALLESMDLIASRSWGGLGSPSHTLLCSCCKITQDKIDHFDVAYPARTMHDHLQHVQLWMSASNSAERNAIWKKHGARYSEWLCFSWWNVFFASAVAPMHWIKNVLEKQLRENMGWSWSVPTGIPSGPKTAKPVTHLELEWGKCAVLYCDSTEIRKTSLTEGLLRYLCYERGIFNAGLPSRRMLDDIDNWRRHHNIIDQDGKLVNPLPSDWSVFNRVSVAKAEFYLSKTKDAPYLVRKSHVGDLRYLCAKFQLSAVGSHAELALRLVNHYKPSKADQAEVSDSKPNNTVAVLGADTMSEIQLDMDNTINPSWMKAPPKSFGTINHGKIGAEEYKSLALVSLPISLVRLWSNNANNAGDAFMLRLNHFLHLMLAVRVLALQSISKHEIHLFTYHYSRYLRDLKTLYPHCTIIPTQHLGLHIPWFLQYLGPATRFNENPCEMFIGMLQDIPTNWKFGELEYTLHKEFVSASNLEALLQHSEIADALGQVGTAVRDFLNTRHPGNSGIFSRGWEVTHPKTTSILSEEIYGRITLFCNQRQIPAPTRHQFVCSKIQDGHMVYQPESASIGNSQIFFKYPGTLDRTAGRIETIFLQSANAGSSGPSQILLLVRPFKILSEADQLCDPYLTHPLIGASGSRLAALVYDQLETGLPVVIEPKDVISHISTCKYRDSAGRFTVPCLVVLSLDLKHSRPT